MQTQGLVLRNVLTDWMEASDQAIGDLLDLLARLVDGGAPTPLLVDPTATAGDVLGYARTLFELGRDGEAWELLETLFQWIRQPALNQVALA